MPNINQRIDPIRRGSLPDLRRGVNETIDHVNWLMGMRANNGTISDGGRGPIIDIPSVAAAGPTPWATDPDGNAAGWKKITYLDFDGSITGFTNSLYHAWTWVGIPSAGIVSAGPIPWMVDPSGNAASFIVCSNNTFWGTGSCPVGTSNFELISFTQAGTNPIIFTGNPKTPPITPPTSPPAFYILASSGDQVQPGVLPRQPVVGVAIATFSTDTSPISCSFTWTTVYDGTQVMSLSGTVTVPNANAQLQYLLIDPAGWLYDPGGVPGYQQGGKKWIYQYQGPISANTDPTFTLNFSYNCIRSANISGNWGIFLIKQ